MLALSIYTPFWPNESEFLDNLGEDLQYGEEFLASLHSTEILFILAFIGSAMIACISYYWWYNNIVKPWGYHYRRRHWFGWLVIAELITFATTYFIEKAKLVNVDLEGVSEFIYMTYIANFVYCILAYFILSIVWCNCLPTNAYKWFNWFYRK